MQNKIDQNYQLLYDADCPLCVWYTEKFVQYNFMDAHCRVPYSQIGPYSNQLINEEKAKNKIALINKKSGKVFYGVDSFIEIIGNKFPWLKKIAQLKLIYWTLGFLYNFISYNRKIIATNKTAAWLSCMPSTSVLFRAIFIAFCGVFVAIVVPVFFHQYLSNFLKNTLLGLELIFFTGQLLFQYIIFKIFNLKDYYNYSGHVSFVSFLGAVFLIGTMTLVEIFKIMKFEFQMLSPLLFGACVMFMFLEHQRRLKVNNLPAFLSYTWLAYRILIYPIAFKMF